MATTQQRHWVQGGSEHADAPPAQPTKFEIVVRQLRLENDPQCWEISPTLRMWAKKHKSSHYVPEYLLHAWNLRPVVED